MARPHKVGLDYFSFDIDFYENKKVRRIMRGCGPGSGTILTCLLCNIYKNGYYMLWDEDSPFDIADKIGVSEGTVSEVITKALQVEFFDSHQFGEHTILTSGEIQNRYRTATIKREEVLIEEKYTVFSDKKQVNGDINGVNAGDNAQSKVKESKGKNSKGNSFVPQLRDAKAHQRQLKVDYEKLLVELKEKDKVTIWTSLKTFLQDHKPEFIEPVVDVWNLFASSYKLSEVRDISKSRRNKFQTRVQEGSFDFLKILEKVKISAHLKGDNQNNWKVTFDWILENDKNYLKILEGNYD